jgi:dTDP-4-dehydrorhamnose reductase
MRVLLTGATGKLGTYLVRELSKRNWIVQAPSRKQLDLSQVDSLAAVLTEFDPALIVHTAAISSMAESLEQPALMQRTNVESSAFIGRWCQGQGRRMLFVSSDMVFDGRQAPYREDDKLCPSSVYGRSKLEAEQLLSTVEEVTIVRPALMFGPPLGQHQSFFDMVLNRLESGQKTSLFSDEWRTPLFYGDMAWALAELGQLALQATIPRILHFGGPQRLSRLEMGLELATAKGLEPNFEIGSIASVSGAEPRPPDLSLSSELIKAVLPKLRQRTLSEIYRGPDSRDRRF